MSWKIISRNSAASAALFAAGLVPAMALAQDIAVETLGPVDPFSIGVLPPSQGGLPDTLWEGSTAELAREAMDRAPVDSASPSVNRLIARALLSGGEPPPGGDSELLAVRRVQILTDAGFAAQAAQLSARTPGILEHEDLAQAQATGALMGGDLDSACRTADTLRAGREGVFWLRLRAVCLAAAGEESRADLTAQLARSEEDSPQFERAFSLLLMDEDDAEAEVVQTADPLVFAAAVRAGSQLSLSNAAPRAMIAPADGDIGALAVLRARQAAEDGLGPVEDVAAALAAYEMPDELEDEIPDGATRLDIALDAPDGAREALLYQLAGDPEAPADQRAQALAATLEDARSASRFIAASQVLLPAIRALPMAAGHDDALLFAQAAAVAGDVNLARQYLVAAGQRPVPVAQVDPDTGAPVPLGLPAPWTPPDPGDVAAVEALIALRAENPDAGASRLQGEGDARVRFVDAVVLDAMGKSAEPDLRLAFLRGDRDEGVRADPNVLLALESAAQAGATAEAALLAAAALGAGPETLAAPDLSRVLRALSRARLQDSAVEAGLEAMLAARL